MITSNNWIVRSFAFIERNAETDNVLMHLHIRSAGDEKNPRQLDYVLLAYNDKIARS